MLGGAVLAAGISLPVVALRTGGSRAIALGLAGAALLALLPRIERRHEAPVLDFAVFASAPFVARLQVRLGSLAALGGLYWFGDWGRMVTPTDAVPGLALLGAGVGLSSAPSQAAAMAGSPRAHAGMAAGVLSTLRYLGGVIGIAALGALLGDTADPASHRPPERAAADAGTVELVPTPAAPPPPGD